MNPHTFPKGHFALLMKVNIMAASIEVNEVIKVGGIQNTLVLWQAVFLAASPLAMAAPPPKLYFALSRSPYRQLRRLLKSPKNMLRKSILIGLYVLNNNRTIIDLFREGRKGYCPHMLFHGMGNGRLRPAWESMA